MFNITYLNQKIQCKQLQRIENIKKKEQQGKDLDTSKHV